MSEEQGGEQEGGEEEGGEQESGLVAVFAPDLGDRSRFDAVEVVHIRRPEQLDGLTLRLVVVDLDRSQDLRQFVRASVPTIGFGSHVDAERHRLAIDVGFTEVMARSVFFRNLTEIVTPGS